MGMPASLKMENDCSSSIDDDNDMGDMMRGKISVDRESNMASDDEEQEIDYAEDKEDGLPTQVKVW